MNIHISFKIIANPNIPEPYYFNRSGKNKITKYLAQNCLHLARLLYSPEMKLIHKNEKASLETLLKLEEILDNDSSSAIERLKAHFTAIKTLCIRTITLKEISGFQAYKSEIAELKRLGADAEVLLLVLESKRDPYSVRDPISRQVLYLSKRRMLSGNSMAYFTDGNSKTNQAFQNFYDIFFRRKEMLSQSKSFSSLLCNSKLTCL